MSMAVGSGGPGGGDDEDTVYRPMAEINITPMVDVMLVLLIIFMVAAPLMVAGVPIELPNTSAAKVSQTKKPMIVSLTAEGDLFIRDEQVPRTSLVSRLQAIKATEGDMVVYVRADKRVPYGEVMEILGRVGEGGYPRVSLLSQPSKQAAAAPLTPQPSATE
jgi:biopolymer transport protein TolR